MATSQAARAERVQRVAAGTALVLLAGAGIAALLFFWTQLLQPQDLAAFSLPFVALAGGVAATFNPCGLPALPAFLTFLGGKADAPLSRRLGLALGVSAGAMSVVLALGLVIAAVGEGTQAAISSYVRWVQLGAGALLIGLAVMHLLDKAERLPVVSSITNVGGRAWDRAVGRPSLGSSYLFGAGFVAVGAG